MAKKKKKAPAEPSDMTTIAISRTNQNCLNAMRRGFEDYDSIISRLVAGNTETYTELVGVDNELPYLHTCFLQLGEDAKKLHHWNGTNWREITFEQANEMMKQPKPNIELVNFMNFCREQGIGQSIDHFYTRFKMAEKEKVTQPSVGSEKRD